MCNNCYNGCGSNHSCNNGGDCGYDYNYGCGYQNSCGYHNNYGCSDDAFDQAARVTRRIMARRACEDRSAAQYLRNLNNCRRCW